MMDIGISRLQADSRAMAFVRSFFRCYLTGTGFNTRGMQNIGLMYAMQPGLQAIHRDRKGFKAALKRYARHYQSHPFWAPCMVGILLHVETSIGQGHFPPKMLPKVRDTTAYTLSAIGDSVFAGSLLIFWALLTICLLLTGNQALAFSIGLSLLLGVQAFRAYTFICGIRQGFKFLQRLKRWDLINWGRRVKYANAALLLWLWVILWPHPYRWWELLIGLSTLMLFGRFVRTGMMTRVLAVAVLMAIITCFPWLEDTFKTGFGL
ncbi:MULTISPECIES: PTS system mannose/fructose/sorbose family transporter subunit IID [unclassified Pseudodesulfovibrio]|uniref:PTS system mannose/fructose/sorbose family transporter subunit IID n=1 Tax=unclassified Pseudodesulfovibrio TaxID=2661612 RepID=UPI000FEBBD1E|nr:MULTISPECIES: PTS system mannose/fructose/sorbose family transporter subunit IID [unclassified Pseudodesulfovibrio]MCJ2166140.1 PTS system mannose/fructose/sorbose family transporter subunit IID [Pseudodesulfovibrio sp. S3-i]RWU02373.1 3-keto-L-gulonate transporter [Pseudodesulfovibrio sp. S3]